MKVTFYIHTPKDPTTAVFGSVSQRAAHIEGLGYSASVVAPEDMWGLRRTGGRWYPLFYSWWVLWDIVIRRRARADIVVFHSHAGWALHLCRSVLPWAWKITTVTEFHGLEPLHYRQLKTQDRPLSLRFRTVHGIIMPLLLRMSCRRSDEVHCLNSEEEDYLVDHGWADRSRVWRYSNGVPVAFLSLPRTARPVLKFLFLGQWLERKGVTYLAQAFSAIHRARTSAKLLCIGTGVQEAEVLAAFPRECRPAITVVPRLSHSEILDYLASADAFVFPTLHEGFSMALLEAMAAALPIVTTQAGAAPDLFAGSEAAICVPFRNALALEEAMNQLIDNPDEARRRGGLARRIARDFEWSAVCERYSLRLLALSRTARS